MKLFDNSLWGRNRPLRPGQNPLADRLIEENSRLRRERNDWMREAERLKRLVDAYEGDRNDGSGGADA